MASHPGFLRQASPRDLETLVRHRRHMWEDMGRIAAGAPDPSEGPYRRWLLTHLLAGDLVGFLVEDAGAPVASGCVWLQETQPRPGMPEPRTPYCLSLFVEPTHRGQGIARAIMQAVIAQARHWGARRISLHASDEGRAMYAALGFTATPEMWLALE